MLGKGLRLLVALGDHPDGAGVSRLARDVEVPVSTAHRLLAGMVPLGFASFDRERRRYSLGLRAFELGQRVASARRLSDVALPAMRRVTQATGETTLLAVLSGDDVLYVERTESKHLAQIWGAPGARGSPHYTSLGKCLVAFLPEEEREEILARLRLERLTPRTITDAEGLREELHFTRERGYATNDEEHEEGVRAVGVPVIGRHNRPAAALSVATLTFRYSMQELEGFVPLLREAAREVEVQLRSGGPMTKRGDEDVKSELVERVRRFVAEEVAPRAAGIDRENAFPGDVYRRMGEEGLLGLARPQGAGKTTLEWAVWIEELAAASATVADIVCSADLVALILDEHGTEEHKSMIGPLLAGERVGAFALTEAQAGSNAAAIETVARREGDTYVLEGKLHGAIQLPIT